MTSPLARLAGIIHRESGIQLAERNSIALEAAVARAAPGKTANDFLRLVDDPVAGPRAVERLVEEITIQETSFLRDADQLRSIDWRALAASATGTLRVWTAGCATGEEAYTLGILASEAFAPSVPPVSILATDISAAGLERASAGRYAGRRIAALPQRLREHYFVMDGDALVVGSGLRRLVSFARHNLVSDPIPPLGEAPFDLIVCRNVLIYFDAPTVERVRASLVRAVRPGGTLLLGAADALGAGGSPQPPLAQRATPARPPAPRRASTPPSEPDASTLDARTHFVRGLNELENGDAVSAVASFRRAVYVDPDFGLAAFTLGRAHEALGDRAAATRAYRQALHALADVDHDPVLTEVSLGDVEVACRARLEELR
jgi:chemotaxis protein methyltransferase CheR